MMGSPAVKSRPPERFTRPPPNPTMLPSLSYDHCWLVPPLQVKRSSWVPLATSQSGRSRQKFGLILDLICPLELRVHCWLDWSLPQGQMSIFWPLASLDDPPAASMHHPVLPPTLSCTLLNVRGFGCVLMYVVAQPPHALSGEAAHTWAWTSTTALSGTVRGMVYAKLQSSPGRL